MSDATDELRLLTRDSIATADLNDPVLVGSEQTVEFMYGKQADAVVAALVERFGEPEIEHDKGWFSGPGTQIPHRRLVFAWKETDHAE